MIPPFALEMLRKHWLTIGLVLAIAGLTLACWIKDGQIDRLKLDVERKQLAIDVAKAEYESAKRRVEALQTSNRLHVDALTKNYRNNLTEERKKHAETYRIAIAHADAAGRMRLAAPGSGSCAMPEDGAASGRTDADPTGEQSEKSVTIGDCIDAAVQIEGLQKYIGTQLQHVNNQQ